MLTGRDIIIISSIEWDFNWQGHQEIAKRFARAGNRVLYIENMGVRSPGVQDSRRVATRFSNWAKALPGGGVRELFPNLYVCSPLILPPFGSKARQVVNRRVLLEFIRYAVKRLNFNSDIILTYLPTDTVVALIELLRNPKSVTVYYCIADFKELTPHAEAILESERSVIEMSDVVFAQSRNLAERCLVSKKEVEIFPFGVNMELFSPRECSSTDLREEPRAENFKAASSVSASTSVLPRPVIGYVGGIHKHFDAPMLSAMARARPRWSWALVGPLQTAQGALERIPNIHLLGPKAHEELPHYICDFDVGIVPYLHNDYTMTVVPTKIKEYLAMGKPVVSTNLPEVNAFNDKHNVIITSSNHPTEFLSSIEKALDLSKEEVIVARRRKVAALHDWEERLERMSDNIEHKLNLK